MFIYIQLITNIIQKNVAVKQNMLLINTSADLFL